MTGNAPVGQLTAQFVACFDQCADDFSRDSGFVAGNGEGNHEGSQRAHTGSVVNVHGETVLHDAFPYREISRFLPYKIGKRAFGASAIDVLNGAKIIIAHEHVWQDFAEGSRKNARIEVLDGGLHVFFA